MDVQGQSRSTEDKERGFASMFAINLRIFQAKFPGHIYFHFDLHAGSGWNEKVNVVGSPLLFVDLANDTGVDYRIHAVEQDKGRASTLAGLLGHSDRAFVHHGDNCDFVPLIPELIRYYGDRPEFAIGSILIDPNNTNGIPWNEVASVLGKCPRIDVMCHFPAGAMKRIFYGVIAKGNECETWKAMSDAIGMFRKKHWLIRDPRFGGPHHFTTLIGRNIAIKEHRSIGFHSLETREGFRLFQKAVLNKAEYQQYIDKQQLILFD